jgi:hypothetical protein
MKFYYYNLVELDATVITASNDSSNFPASNLKDYRSTKAFRSTTTSSAIVFDFITAQAVDSVIVSPHKLNGFTLSTPITIEANASDSWGAPSFSTTITSLDSEFGYTLKEFASQSYRYWRVSLTSATYAELGNIFIGSAMTIGTEQRTFGFGWKYSNNDLAKITTNRYGQIFSDLATTQREISGSFSNLTLDQVDNFFELYDYNGKTKPFYFYIDCDGFSNTPNRFLGHYRLVDKPDVSNKFFGLYDTNMKMLEVN